MSKAPHKIQPLPRALFIMIGAAVLLNYVDRGNLATAAPLVRDELGLSGSQMGLLFSAFFWTYAPGQLLIGWAVHRFDVRTVLLAGVVAWSLATAATGFAVGFVSLLVLRLVLGLGETVTFPSTQLLLARHAPEDQRGMLNGFIAVGQGIGPMLGTLLGGLLMAEYGWRAMFMVVGGVTLLWAGPWMYVTRHAATAVTPHRAATSVSYREILNQRDFWGAALGHFCANYGFYFVLTWLPSFLVKSAGLSVPQMAATASIIYGLYAVSTAASGYASDWWIRRGYSVTRVRKSFIIASLTGVGLLSAVCGVVEPGAAVILLCVCGVFFGLGTPMVFTIGTSLAGPNAAGKWAGAQNVAGQMAGITAPVVTGFIVDATGSYSWAFALAALFSVIGIGAWGFILRTIAPLQWAVPQPTS